MNVFSSKIIATRSLFEAFLSIRTVFASFYFPTKEADFNNRLKYNVIILSALSHQVLYIFS